MCGRVSRSLAARLLVGKLKRGCGTCHARCQTKWHFGHCSKQPPLPLVKQYSGHRIRTKRFEDRGLDLRLPA